MVCVEFNRFMVKAIYTFAVVVLICAGGVFVLCGLLLRDSILQDKQNTLISSLEKTDRPDTSGRNPDANSTSPLLKQAGDFALVVNPPPEPKPALKITETVKVVSEPAVAAKVQLRFYLLATSCYRFRPEKSVALIWEPGSGERWVSEGENIAHFVVETIKDGAIIYNDGSQVREVAVESKPPVEIAASKKAGSILGLDNIRPDSGKQQIKTP
jgi:hypothetical protein